MDYSRRDALDASDDDDERGPTAAIDGGSQGIWADLMSGKKNLLTRDGVVSGVEVARALGAVMPETQQSHAKSTAGGGVDAAGRRERLKEYILSQYKDRLPGPG